MPRPRAHDETVRQLRPGERLVLAAVEEAETTTRSELARATGLPGSTVVGIVGKLLAEGALVEQASVVAGVGRPAKRLALPRFEGLVAVLAVSRHEVRAGLVAPEGDVRARAVLPVEALEVADVITPGVALLENLLRESGVAPDSIAAAVVGVPGPFRRGAGVIPRPDVPEAVRDLVPGGRPGWMRQDPAPLVTERLGVPALAENDANLGALGEATYGAGRDLGIVVYVKYAQGLGAGVVIDGRPLRGASGHGGELTHVRVDDDGPVCTCGGRGCLAIMTSPDRFLSLLQMSYRGATAMDDVIALAEHGDLGVLGLLRDAGRLMGRPLADLCAVLNPHAIVLDSRLGAAGPPVLEGIRWTIDRYALAPAAEAVRVVPGTLGADAELLGAVALARLEGVLPRTRPQEKNAS